MKNHFTPQPTRKRFSETIDWPMLIFASIYCTAAIVMLTFAVVNGISQML